MNVLKLLDLDVINLNTVKESLMNRDKLKKGMNVSDFSIYEKFTSISDPPIFNHDNPELNLLFCVSRKRLIPIFPSDQFLIDIGSSQTRVNSDQFFSNILDGLSELDNLISSNRDSLFKIGNVKKITMTKWDDKEEVSFYKTIEEMNENIIGNQVRKILLNHLSSYFSNENLNKGFLTEELVKWLKNDSIFEVRLSIQKDQLFHDFLIKNISNYLNSKDIFYLIEIIKSISLK